MTNKKLPNVNRIHFPFLSLSPLCLFISLSSPLTFCSSLITEEEIQSSNLFFSPFPFVLIDVETRDIFLFSDQTCFIFGLGRLLSPRANHSFRFFSLFSWRGFGIPSQKTRKDQVRICFDRRFIIFSISVF